MSALPTTLRVEELGSGITYGFVLPNISRMLLSGFFPAPVDKVARQFVSGKLDVDKIMSDDELGEWEAFQSRLVAWMVRQIDGEEVELKADDVDAAESFPQDDRQALFARAIRLAESPKAVRTS